LFNVRPDADQRLITNDKRQDDSKDDEQQIERIQRLPKAQQRFVMQMLDTVLAQADR
jgi:hypothetical protein